MFWPGYAVGIVTLSLLNAGLAHAYGRSRSLTFIASLIFGPLATAVLVVLGKRSP